jgi:hypothetical protein
MGAGQGRITRRGLLAGAAAVGATALVGSRGSAGASSSFIPQHLSWVWQFQRDGSKEEIRDLLAAHGLGILLKTHDGTNWMSRFDRAPDAVTGPDQVRDLVRFFESAGVPFHAWCVVKGVEAVREAEMAAEVIAAGARSMYVDLEAAEGELFWQATPHEAVVYGHEFRRRQPNAWVSIAPDARPWQVARVPMKEFADMANEVAPQAYWRIFDSPTNHRMLRERGFSIDDRGVTPELIIDVTERTFSPYRLPIRPIGEGAASGYEWRRFIAHSYSRGMDAVSVWRHGVSSPEVWPVLREMAPQPILRTVQLKEQQHLAELNAYSLRNSLPEGRDSIQTLAPALQYSARGTRESVPEGVLAQEGPSRPRRLFWDIGNLRHFR